MKTEDFQTLWITAQDTPTKEAYVAETGVGRIWCDIDCYDPVPDARKEEELIADEEMPAIQDLIHSEYAIRSMRWIIRHRNDDCVGLRKVDASKIPRYYVDEYTTRRQHHQDVPSRHRFETILGMIPDHEIEQSIERYHEVHNDILLRFYQSRLIFTEQENRLREMGTANLEGVYAIVKDGLSLGNQVFQNPSGAIMTNSLQPAGLDLNRAQLLAKQAYDRECVRREKLDLLGQRCAKLYDAIVFSIHGAKHIEKTSSRRK